MHDRIAVTHPTSRQYGRNHMRRLKPVVRVAPAALHLPDPGAEQADWQALFRVALVAIMIGVAIAAVRFLAQ